MTLIWYALCPSHVCVYAYVVCCVYVVCLVYMGHSGRLCVGLDPPPPRLIQEPPAHTAGEH